MSDCRLTRQVQGMLDGGGEIHQEVTVRMPDGKTWKVHRDGSTEFLWEVSGKDAEKFHPYDSELGG